ncbi:MAG TPA: YlxR family protein [Candidatus Limnocylindrales bacterium]|nr:YlxR family protein [Candidatus Limnocylindrales bacterium]
MVRSGSPAPRRAPTRSCVACRTTREKRELVRVVRTPDGRITIDETGRLAGRGAYLCRDAGCWTRAVERGAIGRALEAPVPPELREVLLAGPTMMTMTGGAARGQE